VIWENTAAIIRFQWCDNPSILAKHFDNIGAVPGPLYLRTVRVTVSKTLCLKKLKTADR
jgi:hypothetical protein